MKRIAYKELLKWKNSPTRKPIVLYGARQVGKTWLLKEFGKNEYKKTLYLNFDTDRELHKYFGDNITPENIIRNLSLYFNTDISAEETLLIFDEVQECQRAKDSLKYFNEDAPQYHIAAAGSFLGIATGKFPVGQVDEITLLPMSFYEFLNGIGKERYLEVLQKRDFSIIPALSGDFVKLFKTYLFVGGMPAVLKVYAETDDLRAARNEQEKILNNYKQDFTKHISKIDIPKVRMIWDSIPIHLAKEKKKFVYKEIKIGGRASEFENALDWLINTGLVYKVCRVPNPQIPIAVHKEQQYFKLYMLDIGLLSAKAEVPLTNFIDTAEEVLGNFNGALTEQFVMQELKSSGCDIYYWGRDKGTAEVDFVVQLGNEIIPIEVKAGIRKKSKNLDVYREFFHPKRAIKATLNNFGIINDLYSLPLYMIASFNDILTTLKQQTNI